MLTIPICVCRKSQSFWMFWRVALWRGWLTEIRRGAKVFRGQPRRSTPPSLCITPHRPPLLRPPPPAWVQLLQRSGRWRLRVGEVEIARLEVAVTCCLQSSLNCWAKEEWERWIRVEQWSAVAIIIITINTTMLMSNLHLPQPARKNSPVSQILHPAHLQLPSRHLKIAPLLLHPSPLPLSTHLPIWENARGPPVIGRAVPCPLSPPPLNVHPTHLPKRVAKKENRRMRGRCKSWQSKTSVWRQRLKDWEKRYRELEELWLRG